ncbi:MAG: hypothetical protein IPM71_15860 [Bacteroidota bacterium]|nr:MAG: hypothetical protein IPM71_15860 [Bacteroidota bacterium]
MEQKIMWMRYLLFGISTIIAILTFSCERTKDYSVNTKWIYINETSHSITYEPSPIWDEFNISGNDTVVYIQNSEGPKNVEANDFVPPINANVLINSLICDSSLTSKIHNISEYESTKLSERNFEFTFRFTDININLTDTCK